MAKVINFDLSGAEEEVWEQSEGRVSEDPKPGIYKGKINQINPGFSKGDGGQPDKSRPRLEVVVELVGDAEGDPEGLATRGNDGGNCLGAWLWDYVSFSKASEWKQAQFFKAIGEGSPKKAKGKFNAEKHEGKTFVKVRVKADTYNGEYSPKVAAMWPWDDDDASTEDIDDELDDEETEVYTEDELNDMSIKDIRKVAEEFDVEIKKGKKKNTYVREILEAQDAEEDEDEDEELEDEDEELEDEDEDIDDDTVTEDQIKEMSPAELKALAKEHGVSLKGMTKSKAVDALIEAVVNDDEVPF